MRWAVADVLFRLAYGTETQEGLAQALNVTFSRRSRQAEQADDLPVALRSRCHLRCQLRLGTDRNRLKVSDGAAVLHATDLI
jgi:hypothetical protein